MISLPHNKIIRIYSDRPSRYSAAERVMYPRGFAFGPELPKGSLRPQFRCLPRPLSDELEMRATGQLQFVTRQTFVFHRCKQTSTHSNSGRAQVSAACVVFRSQKNMRGNACHSNHVFLTLIPITKNRIHPIHLPPFSTPIFWTRGGFGASQLAGRVPQLHVCTADCERGARNGRRSVLGPRRSANRGACARKNSVNMKIVRSFFMARKFDRPNALLFRSKSRTNTAVLCVSDSFCLRLKKKCE